MRIVHIAPNAPYNEGWSYQENLLPKYQKKLGHEVVLIISNTMHQDGKVVKTECCDRVMDDGVRLIRLPLKKTHIWKKIDSFFEYMDVFKTLKEIRPDYIFFHGLVSPTILQATRYKKEVNQHCVIVQDNHMDPIIGNSSVGLKMKILRLYYRSLHRMSRSSVDRVYGVTPWRKQYAENYFKVSPSKTDVLIMGADDESMDYIHRDDYRRIIREKYGISKSDFLVVSGGKIEDNKKIDVLIEACGNLEGTKLLLFGSIDPKIEKSFYDLLKKYPKIIYIGWINSQECYKFFYAADLVCFPGRHSVLWEQACASKVPCLIKHFDGMEHVDVGGNTILTGDETPEQYRDTILSLRFTEKYNKMVSIARSSKTDVFLYSTIAKKSLDDYCYLVKKALN